MSLARSGGGLALAAALLAACAGHAADLAKTGPKASDFYCSSSEKGAAAIAAALQSSDEDDYQDAIRLANPVPPGTALRVLEQSGGTHPMLHVKVVDGPFKDHDCWYPADLPGLVQR